MSFYRKYRPQTFEDVVGQEHIAQTLRNALSADPIRIAHAYLFCGPRGTGKTTSARLLAKCLNCERGPTPTPCNECESCVAISTNQPTMDVTEMDAASNRGIDDARKINERAGMAPAQGKYRIYIIDEVHQLTPEAFNALLKTVEEPPAHLVFVLATTDANKVPQTITSRCQRFDFRRVGPQDIVGRLQHVARGEGLHLSDDAARLIARTADGALRDALTLLEQVAAFAPEHIEDADVRLVLGTVSQELLLSLMDAAANMDAASALQQIARATEEGVSFSQLTRDLTNYARELLLLTVGFEGDGTLTKDETKRRAAHSQQIGRARLMELVEALRAAEKEMRQSTDHRLLLELTMVRAASNASSVAPVASTQAASTQAASLPRLDGPWKAPQRAEKPVAPTVATPRIEVESKPPLAPASPAASDNNGQGPVPSVEPMARVPVLRDAAPVKTEELPAEAAQEGEELPEVEVAPTLEVAPVAVQAEEVEGDSEAQEVEAAPEAEPQAAAPVEVESEVETPIEAAPKPQSEALSARKRGRRIQNLEDFIELWPHVLVRYKKKIGVSAVAYLHDARPVEFSEKDAVLEFQKEFHYAKACDAANRLPFEQVLNEVLATPHRLKFRRAEPPSTAKIKPAEPPPSGDDEEDDDVLRVAQDMFGAEVVARSGER